MNIVLHSDDITLVSYWQDILGSSCQIVDTLEALEMVETSLVIINYGACPQNNQEIFKRLQEQNNHILILDRTPDFLRAKQLLNLGVKGYGNALMRDHYLRSAVRTIEDGLVWLYPEFTTALIQEMKTPAISNSDQHLQKLSKREHEVALLLKEGDTYKNVAEKLGITARTVKAHAQHIYEKLNVKDRLGLALLLK